MKHYGKHHVKSHPMQYEVKVKVNFTPEQAMKAQMVSRRRALLFL
jgi:hypothetical protein